MLEQWNPDQVYQRALTWVGEELQEQLLEGFFQGATPDYVDIHQFIEYLRSRGLSPLIDPRLKGTEDGVVSTWFNYTGEQIFFAGSNLNESQISCLAELLALNRIIIALSSGTMGAH